MLHNREPADAKALLQLVNAGDATLGFAHWCAAWHEDETRAAPDTVLLHLHRANFDLWHLEDRARDPRSSDTAIAEVKRAIDQTNQLRNDLAERTDVDLMSALAAYGLPNALAPLHSEGPGQILDRLSILSLKLFHTQEETERSDVSPAHVKRNVQRLAILKQQSDDLTGCLGALWHQVCRGERQFKLYRQMKMYNDPELNPVLYRREPSM